MLDNLSAIWDTAKHLSWLNSSGDKDEQQLNVKPLVKVGCVMLWRARAALHVSLLFKCVRLVLILNKNKLLVSWPWQHDTLEKVSSDFSRAR